MWKKIIKLLIHECTNVTKMSFLKGRKYIDFNLLSLVSSISHRYHWVSFIKQYETHFQRSLSAVIKKQIPGIRSVWNRSQIEPAFTDSIKFHKVNPLQWWKRKGNQEMLSGFKPNEGHRFHKYASFKVDWIFPTSNVQLQNSSYALLMFYPTGLVNSSLLKGEICHIFSQ